MFILKVTFPNGETTEVLVSSWAEFAEWAAAKPPGAYTVTIVG